MSSDAAETWLPIVGHDDLYEVSSFGRVRNVKRHSFLKLKLSTNGIYRQVILYEGGKRRCRDVHRLVIETFRGPCSEGHECRHLNGLNQDNRLANLEWGTRLQNAADKIRHGTQPRGSKHGRHKLYESDVLMIRSDSRPSLQLAAELGVSISTINEIRSGKKWKHLLVESVPVPQKELPW